nr:MAG TPA: hypothetical protein [Bacteriophage sp.]
MFLNKILIKAAHNKLAKAFLRLAASLGLAFIISFIFLILSS